jgi:cytidylate kinase
MIIAIDGPSASGKSTTAKGVAERLGITHLDTGAMYRATTYGIIKSGIELNDVQSIHEFLKNMALQFDSFNHVWINGKNVSKKIRTNKISSSVSAVSAIPAVRSKMVEIQRSIAKGKDCVLEGRDIGTVVFPNADFKFFLTADILVRAKRRLKDLEKIGEESTLNDLISDIEKRDVSDSSRDVSPLVQAKDAIAINTSNLTINEQVEKIVQIINK